MVRRLARVSGELNREVGSRTRREGASQNPEPREQARPRCLWLIVSLVRVRGRPRDAERHRSRHVRVSGERFRVQLVNDRQIQAARAAQAGGPARIPIGRIVAASGVNQGWAWHLEDLEFAESAMEVYDGRPSDVERQGVLVWRRPFLSLDRARRVYRLRGMTK